MKTWTSGSSRREGDSGGSGSASSERLDPGPHLDLKRPGAARLAQNLDVGLRDVVGIEGAVGPIGRVEPPPRLAAHPAVDDEVRDVNAFRPQFARGALRETSQCELAHREGGGERVALDAGAGA